MCYNDAAGRRSGILDSRFRPSALLTFSDGGRAGLKKVILMAVDDFLRALDSIEAEIREVPDVVFVEMSLTRGRIRRYGDTFDKTSRT